MLNLDIGFLRAIRGLAGTYALVAAISASAQVPPVPEILYYRFNEAGTSATNYASAPPAGTTTAALAATFSQSNAFSATASSLVGAGVASDFVNTGWATNLTGSSWTLSFFTSNIVPSATLWYILGDDATTFRCFTNGVAGANNWILRGTGIADVLVTGAADANQHMVTFVYDNSVPEIRAYKDAVLVNTVAQAAISLVSAGPFKVGNYSTRNSLNGNMADFRLYSRALTATEITDVYNYVEKSYFVGGTVSGLTAAGLVLQNNGGDDLPIAADGSFKFATPLLDAANYDVTVSAQPAGQNCLVSNGSGTLAGASVTNVAVDCSVTPADLLITVDDGLNYVHYGQPVDYLVTLNNRGGTPATDVTVSSTVTGLDAALAQWSCTPAGGATCTATGNGPFGDTVTVPFNGSLSWLVSMPALLTGDTVEFDVAAPGTTASDIDTLVIFRDGFGN